MILLRKLNSKSEFRKQIKILNESLKLRKDLRNLTAIHISENKDILKPMSRIYIKVITDLSNKKRQLQVQINFYIKALIIIEWKKHNVINTYRKNKEYAKQEERSIKKININFNY